MMKRYLSSPKKDLCENAVFCARLYVLVVCEVQDCFIYCVFALWHSLLLYNIISLSSSSNWFDDVY